MGAGEIYTPAPQAEKLVTEAQGAQGMRVPWYQTANGQ